MALEVTKGESCQCRVAVDPSGGGDPVRLEDEVLLAVSDRTEGQHARMGEVPDEVIAALVGGVDTCVVQKWPLRSRPRLAKLVRPVLARRARRQRCAPLVRERRWWFPFEPSRPAAAASSRGARRSRSQARSVARTRWRVPRRGQARTTAPASQVASTSGLLRCAGQRRRPRCCSPVLGGRASGLRRLQAQPAPARRALARQVRSRARSRALSWRTAGNVEVTQWAARVDSAERSGRNPFASGPWSFAARPGGRAARLSPELGAPGGSAPGTGDAAPGLRRLREG
jgi:hypothetical protein